MTQELREEIKGCFPCIEAVFDEKRLREFSGYSESDLCLYHFTTGLYIRNTLLKPDSALYERFVRDGVCDRDQMSAMVVREFYIFKQRERLMKLPKQEGCVRHIKL